MKKNIIKIIITSIIAIFALFLFIKLNDINISKKPRIGIAWVTEKDIEMYQNVFVAVEKAGGEPIALEQIVNND